ncbi:hypothetical protein CIHG_09005 [Coccidioides immitis H538.4]|uniref:Uncharacterized protein n=1 Tax=Coccidioides immitis H538.4 TaxID=396776 RepID=A0A0J8S0X6_COCIT|nr:hypothetical protein CIHG_09005 [Coccidioides immitis H538.4]
MDVSFPFTKPTSLKFLLVRKKMNMSPQMTFATGEFLEIQTQEVISKRVPEPNHMEPTSFWFWQQGLVGHGFRMSNNVTRSTHSTAIPELEYAIWERAMHL